MNNKGAEQPTHPRSLISAFVVRCLDSNEILQLKAIQLDCHICPTSQFAESAVSLHVHVSSLHVHVHLFKSKFHPA